MNTISKVVLGVVLSLVLHMALVVAFPSYSQDAADYQRMLVDQQQDKAVMDTYLQSLTEED